MYARAMGQLLNLRTKPLSRLGAMAGMEESMSLEERRCGSVTGRNSRDLKGKCGL